MNLYLPQSIITPIYFYLGWNELRRYPGVPDLVWSRLIADMCQDVNFKMGYDAYNSVCRAKRTVKKKLLYYINFLLNLDENNIPIIMLMNKDFMRIYTWFNGISDMKFIKQHLRSDPTVLYNIIRDNGQIGLAPESLRTNEDFLIKVIHDFPEILQGLDDRWRLNEQFLLKIVSHECALFGYFDDDYKSNKEFVLKALKINDGVWYGVSYSLKLDQAFVIEAIKINYKIVTHEDLWDIYPNLLGRIVEKNKEMIKCIFVDCKRDPRDGKQRFNKISKINPKILLNAIDVCGFKVLEYADISFGKDEKWALKLLKITSRYCDEYRKIVVDYIDPKLKADPDFLMKALQINSPLWSNYLVPINSDVRTLCDTYGRVKWMLR